MSLLANELTGAVKALLTPQRWQHVQEARLPLRESEDDAPINEKGSGGFDKPTAQVKTDQSEHAAENAQLAFDAEGGRQAVD